MKIPICICALLALTLTQSASAGDKHKGGSGKGGGGKGGGGGAVNAVHGAGGAGGRGPGAHMGGGGQHNVRGNNLHGGGQTGHGQHGLNAHQGAGHGLNAHQGARQGLNARAGGGLQGHRAANALGHRVGNNRFAGRGRFGTGHWRSGQHWRNYHALYAGYHRAWHDRGWWRGHYNRVVFVGGNYWGGNWYWDGGYWFPAWGYVPGYSGYVYDGPIFAYANLPPDQVVVNIQETLQDQGYYAGEIDGQLGQQTRDALAAYQRDHNLELTAAIDEATVQSLGLASEEA
jgi:hypothetical protein